MSDRIVSFGADFVPLIKQIRDLGQHWDDLAKKVKDVISADNALLSAKEKVLAKVKTLDDYHKNSIISIKNVGTAIKDLLEPLRKYADHLGRIQTYKAFSTLQGMSPGKRQEIMDHTRALEENKRKALEAAEAQERLLKSQQLDKYFTGVNRQALGGTSGLYISDEQKAKFQEAIQKIKEYALAHNIAASEVKRAWQNVGLIDPKTKIDKSTWSGLSDLVIQARNAKNELGLVHANARKTAEEIPAITRATEKTKEEAKGLLLNWTSLTRLFLIQVFHRVLANMITLFRQGATEAFNFRKAVAEIQTIDFAGLGFQEWQDQLLRLSSAWGTDIREQAAGLYDAISDQIVTTSAEAEKFMSVANQLASTGVTTVDNSIKLLGASLNAFNIDITQADEVAATLFKTVDLGRVRIEEMADSFGRIAVPAKLVGASFAELNSMIQVITIRGVKFEESMTYIRNIMMKMLNPTEELIKLYKEWGVPSADIAIKATSLAEVLQKVEQKTKGTSSEIAKLFREMRAVTGAMMFTGEGLNLFMSNLEETVAGMTDYVKAGLIVFDEPANKLKRDWNEVKNKFIELSSSIIDFAAKADLIKSSFEVLGTTFKFIAYSAIVPALAAITAGIVKLYTLVATNPILLAIGAIGGVIYYLVEHTNLISKNVDTIAEKSKELRRQMEEGFLRDREYYAELISMTNKYIEDSNKPLRKYMMNMSADINTYIKNWSDVIDKSLKSIAYDFDLIQKKSNDKLSKLREDISKINSLITSLETSRSNIVKTDFTAKFNADLAELGDDLVAKSKLVKTTLQDAIASLSSARSEDLSENAANAMRAANEYVSISTAALEKQKDIRKKLADLEFNAAKQYQDKRDALLKASSQATWTGNTFAVHAARKELDQWEATYNRTKAELQKELRLSALTGKDVEDAKAFIEVIKQAQIKRIDELLLYETEKKKQLLDEEEKEERAKIDRTEKYRLVNSFKLKSELMKIENLDELYRTFNEFAQASKDLMSEGKDPEANKRIQARLIEVEILARTQEINLKNNELQKKTDEHIRNQTEGMQRLNKIMQEYQNLQLKIAETGTKLDENLKKSVLDFTKIMNEMYSDSKTTLGKSAEILRKTDFLGDRLTLDQRKPQEYAKLISQSLVVMTEEAYKSAGKEIKATIEREKLLTNIKDLLPKAIDTEDPELIQKAALAINKFKEKFILDALTLDKKHVDNIKAQLAAITDYLSIFDMSKQLNSLRKLEKETKEILDALGVKWEEKIKQQINFYDEQHNMLQKNAQDFRDNAAAIELIKQEITKLGIELQRMIPNLQAKPEYFGGPIYREAGGFVPRGTDTIPAMLSPGEFVVNASATRRFYSQLIAMNSGTRAGISNSTVNLGGVSISVQDSGNPQLTAKTIVAEINRGIRQGVFKIRSN